MPVRIFELFAHEGADGVIAADDAVTRCEITFAGKLSGLKCGGGQLLRVAVPSVPAAKRTVNNFLWPRS